MATYYFRNSGDVYWGVATNWSLTDGGPANGAVPTSVDDVIFTTNSGNCTLLGAAGGPLPSYVAICKSINFSTYSGTLTLSSNLQVNGNFTLGSSMSITGSSGLQLGGTCTITPNGKTWPNNLTLASPVSYSLASNFTVTGSLTINFTTASNYSLNGFNLYVGGSLLNTNVGNITGTTVIIMNGTGTLNCSSTGRISSSLTINTSTGTITINTLKIGGGTFTYTSGTIAGTKTLDLVGGTMNVSGITWTTLSTSAGVAYTTMTLSQDLYCDGTISFGSTTNNTTQTFNGGNIWFSGTTITHSPTFNGTTISGTTVLRVIGTNVTFSHGLSAMITGVYSLPIVIDTPGSVTLNPSDKIQYKSSITFTQVGSLVTTSNTIVLSSGGSIVNNVSGLTLNGVSCLSSVSFSGTYGFTMSSLSSYVVQTNAIVITFASSKTYVVSGFISLGGNWNGTILLKSSSTGTQAILTLPNNNSTYSTVGWLTEITQLRGSFSYVNVTDIDSSGGKTLWTFGGVLNNATNWRVLSSATKNPTLVS